MNPNKASVKLTFDKVKDGNVSIKLRICFQSSRPRYHLPEKEGIIVSPEVYKKVAGFHASRNGRTAEEVQRIHKKVLPYIEKAEAIIGELSPFSFERFDALFYADSTVKEKSDLNNVIAALGAASEAMEVQGRIGNADAYKSAYQSLVRFVSSLTEAERIELLPAQGKARTNSVIQFDAITPKFLHLYEAWMLKGGSVSRKKGGLSTPASITTVGIYLRQVRTVFNEAIRDKIIPESCYPFSRKGYVIPTGRNVKKALRKSVILDILAYKCEPMSTQERSRDLWVFSYLSNGMNLTDICNLKWSNINYTDQTITFVRKKTSRTQRGNPITILASIFPETKLIIDKWAGTERKPGDFVFPFVSSDMEPRRRKRTISQLVKTTNKYMNLIAKEIGFDAKIKTYEARHSFASAMLKSGADLVYIKDKLGQSSLKSTESYVVSILDEDEQTMMRKSLL